MRDHRITLGCTLLGLLSGIVITWFVSVQSGTTLAVWKDELFVQRLWDGWLAIVSTAVLPILIGLLTGLRKNNLWGLLLTPIFAILASAAALLLVALVILLMQYFEFVSFLGFAALIGILIPPTATIVVIVVSG